MADVGALSRKDKAQDQARAGQKAHTNKSKSPILLPKSLPHTPKPPAPPMAALHAETNQSLSLLLSS